MMGRNREGGIVFERSRKVQIWAPYLSELALRHQYQPVHGFTEVLLEEGIAKTVLRWIQQNAGWE